MNKYEEEAVRRRKAALRSGMSMWTAGLALIVVALAILGFRSSAPPDYFYKGGAALAAILLLLRQVGKRLKAGVPRAAQPDPKSTLHLSE